MTYVSQRTYDSGTPAQRAGWTVDQTITSGTGSSGGSGGSYTGNRTEAQKVEDKRLAELAQVQAFIKARDSGLNISWGDFVKSSGDIGSTRPSDITPQTASNLEAYARALGQGYIGSFSQFESNQMGGATINQNQPTQQEIMAREQAQTQQYYINTQTRQMQSQEDIQRSVAEKMGVPYATVAENWNKKDTYTGKTLQEQYQDFLFSPKKQSSTSQNQQAITNASFDFYVSNKPPDLSPRVSKNQFVDVQIPDPFGLQKMNMVTGRGEPVTFTASSIVLSTSTNRPFGISTPASPLGAPQEVITKSIATTPFATTYSGDVSATKAAWQVLEAPAQTQKEEPRLTSLQGIDVSGDIDKRWQEMIKNGDSIYFGKKPSDDIGATIWGAKVFLLEGTAVEGTKMGLGFTQATTSYGEALRYGDPRYSYWIGATQSIAGTKPMLSYEATEQLFKQGGQGVFATFAYPVTLAALGKAQGFISEATVTSASTIGGFPVIKQAGAAVAAASPFEISGAGIAKAVTSPPVFFGALSGISANQISDDPRVGFGAGVGAFVSLRTFEMVGEKIISGKQSSSEYKPQQFAETLFVKEKTYETTEQAAKFFLKSSPDEFAKAASEGTKFGAYKNAQTPNWEVKQAAGERLGFGSIERTNSAKSGFSGEELRMAIVKAQGKELPARFIPVEYGRSANGQVIGRIEINPEYGEVMRSADYLAAIKGNKNAKPTFWDWSGKKITGSLGMINEASQDVSGYYVQKLVNAAPGIRPPEIVSKTIDGMESKFIEPSTRKFVETKFSANVALDKALNPELSKIYEFGNKPPLKSKTSLLEVKPNTPLVAAFSIGASSKQSQNNNFNLRQSSIKFENRFSQQQTQLQSTRQSLLVDMNQVLNQGLVIGVRQGDRQGLRQEALQTIRQDLVIGQKHELKQDIRQDLVTGLKQELKQNIKEPPKTGFILPPLPQLDSEGSPTFKKTKIKSHYQPSFTAILFNIKGKKGNIEQSGFGLRPLISTGKSSKKKRNWWEL